MPYAKNDYKFRYREKVNGVLLPFTEPVQLNDTNSEIRNGKLVLRVGNKHIPKGYLELIDPIGSVIRNPEDFTLAQEPSQVFTFTFPLTLS